MPALAAVAPAAAEVPFLAWMAPARHPRPGRPRKSSTPPPVPATVLVAAPPALSMTEAQREALCGIPQQIYNTVRDHYAATTAAARQARKDAPRRSRERVPVGPRRRFQIDERVAPFCCHAAWAILQPRDCKLLKAMLECEARPPGHVHRRVLAAAALLASHTQPFTDNVFRFTKKTLGRSGNATAASETGPIPTRNIWVIPFTNPDTLHVLSPAALAGLVHTLAQIRAHNDVSEPPFDMDLVDRAWETLLRFVSSAWRQTSA